MKKQLLILALLTLGYSANSHNSVMPNENPQVVVEVYDIEEDDIEEDANDFTMSIDDEDEGCCCD